MEFYRTINPGIHDAEYNNFDAQYNNFDAQYNNFDLWPKPRKIVKT